MPDQSLVQKVYLKFFFLLKLLFLFFKIFEYFHFEISMSADIYQQSKVLFCSQLEMGDFLSNLSFLLKSSISCLFNFI